MEVFSPGQRLADRYRLAEPIGSGGMSHVWRAVDEVLGRPVAVKALDAALHADPQLRSAIRREARAAASIAHPAVTQVYDFGEEPLPDGGVAPYLVMELLVGANLADRLARGPLPWPDAVAVGASVAGALSAAHRLGVVHRDIKPANVMLTDGGAKVVDFGIAAMPAGGEDDGEAPRAGTPAYLAPEVLTGGAGTAESDMYALGALLHTALAGTTPLAVKTWAEATLAHERGALPNPILVADLPPEVRELCARCLSPVPWSRPTADEAAKVLGRWSGLVGPDAWLAGPDAPAGPSPQARPVPAGHQTLLDAGVADAPRARSSPVPAGRSRPPVAPAVGAAGRRPRRRRTGFAVIGTALALAGIMLISVAAGLFSPGGMGLGDLTRGAGQPSAEAPGGGQAPAQVAPPSGAATDEPPGAVPADPRTPGAAINAIESEVASALGEGRIDARAADDLSDDLKTMRDRFDSGRTGDMQRSAQNVQRKLDGLVGGGELDLGVGVELNRLVDILIRLSAGPR